MPGQRYIFSSYSGDNAKRDTIASRRLIMTPWYQQRWGDTFQLSRDVNRNTRYENTKGGIRMVYAISGGVTGEGAQRIVVDDPHELDDDMSPTKLLGVADWWDVVMPTRVNDPATASRTIIQQRIHDKDLTGHLQEAMKEEGGRHYEELILPTEYDPKHHHFFSTVSNKTNEPWVPQVEKRHLPEHKQDRPEIAYLDPTDLVDLPEDPRVEHMELLHPQRMPRSEVEALKITLKRKANGQLNQRPVPSEGDLFKERYFRYWTYADKERTLAVLHQGEEEKLIKLEGFRFTTVDLATSLSETADETAISSWIWTESNHLLWLGLEHNRIEGPDIMASIINNRVKFGSKVVGIESGGFQLSMVQTARRRGLPVIKLRPDRDKRTRAIPSAVMMDGEQIYMSGNREDREWTAAAEAQLLKFTGSPNDTDDIVDTLSYAVWLVLKWLENEHPQRQRSWGARPPQRQRSGMS